MKRKYRSVTEPYLYDEDSKYSMKKISKKTLDEINGEITLVNDLCLNNRKRQFYDEIFKSKLGKMNKTLWKWLDNNSDTKIEDTMAAFVSNRGCGGDLIRINVSPLMIATVDTVKNLRKMCDESLEKLSMFCINYSHRGISSLYYERKRYDEYGNEVETISDKSNEPEYIVCITVPFHNEGHDASIDGPIIEIFVVITHEKITYLVTTKQELEIARRFFHITNEGKPGGCIVACDNDLIPKAHVEYVVRCDGGFNSRTMTVNYTDCDVSTNYNDDINYDKIQSFIDSSEPGLAILHGKPGTGKTTLIRKIIWDNREKNKFIIMDKSMFDNITDNGFIMYLMDNVGSVIIFEDCENLLTARENGNSRIDGLLNLSDGILGDMLHMKFICTFNADLIDIDKALLRKGRLKYKYEFKPLEHDKAKQLAKKLGLDVFKLPSGPVCLSDIYNLMETPDSQKKDIKKIGF